MHQAAYDFVSRVAHSIWPRPMRVAELGSRDVNGRSGNCHVRSLFAGAREYVGVDIGEGPDVDVVADARTWQPAKGAFDLIVTCETLEHVQQPWLVVENACRLLRSGGVFLATAAAPPRHPHSALGTSLRPGEYYANVTDAEMRQWLQGFAVSLVDAWSHPGDIYAFAVKGE